MAVIVLVGTGEAALAGCEVGGKVEEAGILSVGFEQAANTITKSNKEFSLPIDPQFIEWTLKSFYRNFTKE